MRNVAAHCFGVALGVSLLAACGKTEAVGAPDALHGVPNSSPPSLLEPPSPIRVVTTTLEQDEAGNYQSQVIVSALDRTPRSLGLVDEAIQSPSSRYLAVRRSGENGVDIISLADGRELRLPGEGATLEGARWSHTGERLAYFARGVPMLANGDGSAAVALEVALLLGDAPTDYSLQAAEWSRDDRQVAFATRALGILVDADAANMHFFSATIVEPFGTPWPLAFSADGQYLAALQTDSAGESRTVLMLNTRTLEQRTIVGIEHYSLVGWTGDDAAVGLWDVSVQLWLVPRGRGAPMRYHGGVSMPSPTKPELALGGPGLHLRNLLDDSERALLDENEQLSFVRFLPDGETIGYGGTSSGYVSVGDGRKLADAFGVARPDGWVVLPNPSDPRQGMFTRDLYGAADSGAAFDMQFPSEEGATSDLVTPWRVSWLKDGRLAYLSSDGVHIAEKDGSRDEVVGPVSESIVVPQAGHFD